MAKMPTFTASAGEIRHAIATALQILQPDPKEPLSSMLILYVEGGRLMIQAQRKQRTLRVPVSGAAQGDYPAVAVDGMRLALLLADIRAEDRLTISRSDNGNVTVETTNIALGLAAHRAKGNPAELVMPPAEVAWRVTAGELRQLLDFAAPAMGTDPAEPHFGGVYLHVIGDALRSAGTDGRYIMSAHCAAPQDGDTPMPTVLPADVVLSLRRLLGDALPADRITVRQYAQGSAIELECTSWRLTAFWEDGRVFADYRSALGPEVGDPIDVADPLTLAMMLRRAGVMANWVALVRTSGRMLRLANADFSQVGGICELTAPRPVAGWRNSGGKVRLLLPVAHLTAICEAFGTRPFTIWAGEEGAPVRFSGEGGVATFLAMRSEDPGEGVSPAEDRLGQHAFVGHA